MPLLSDDEADRLIPRNNPGGEPMGHFTGRCSRCGSKDHLWDDNTAYGCDACGALWTGVEPRLVPNGKNDPANNRDPRWALEVDVAIAQKVRDAMALSPRLELSQDGKTPVPARVREEMLLKSFREIVKATSLDTLMTAPPALLEQLSVMAVLNNENVKGILVQVIRVFMSLWGAPETNAAARKLLLDMEKMLGDHLQEVPAAHRERYQWTAMPTK